MSDEATTQVILSYIYFDNKLDKKRILDNLCNFHSTKYRTLYEDNYLWFDEENRLYWVITDHTHNAYLDDDTDLGDYWSIKYIDRDVCEQRLAQHENWSRRDFNPLQYIGTRVYFPELYSEMSKKRVAGESYFFGQPTYNLVEIAKKYKDICKIEREKNRVYPKKKQSWWNWFCNGSKD